MSSLWNKYDTEFWASLSLPESKLAASLKNGRGTRIGQTTVVSQNMHVIVPQQPECVEILSNIDAGQIFYKLRDKGKVYHLDIFHQSGLVDHKRVAISITEATEVYNYTNKINKVLFYNSPSDGVNPDFIDVQTATGGGRITGDLKYGQKLSLRKAHKNHVHVAAAIPKHHLKFLFYIVVAVEQVIEMCGLELRQNEKIKIASGDIGSKDLMSYADDTDSLLNRSVENRACITDDKKQINDCMKMAKYFDSFNGAEAFIKNLAKAGTISSSGVGHDNNSLLTQLSDIGVIKINPEGIKITKYGQMLNAYLQKHKLDLYNEWRRLLSRGFRVSCGRSKVQRGNVFSTSGYTAGKFSQCDSSKGEIDVASTIVAAARRMVMEGIAKFSIDPGDLRYSVRPKRSKQEICLLVDTSASMKGERISSARFLAQHLLLTTPDRVGVIIFQENWARLQVPFTRNLDVVETSLNKVTVQGGTPLATGLSACLEYLENSKIKKPQIILITDGLPTVAARFKDPVTEALIVAGQIKEKKYNFTCIGIKPYKDFLQKLAEAAGGNVYIVDEIEKQTLIAGASKNFL